MKARPWLLRSSLLASVTCLQSCGTPAPPTRQLLSVTISPTAATAQGAPVQFIATGTYNTQPYTVTPLAANWGAYTVPQQLATVTQSGLATCKKGAPAGTTTVEAWVMIAGAPVCNVIDSAGRPGCSNVGAAAQLTCP